MCILSNYSDRQTQSAQISATSPSAIAKKNKTHNVHNNYYSVETAYIIYHKSALITKYNFVGVFGHQTMQFANLALRL